MAETVVHGRKLGDWKVMDIKDELGKRGLNKKGIKSVLMNRLAAALLAEKQEEEATVDIVSVGSAGNDYENTGIANDVPRSTDSEKLAEGEAESAPLRKVAHMHVEGDTVEEQPMEGLEEAPSAEEESAKDVVEDPEQYSPEAGDTDRNIERLSSSMELPHIHEEELIYEGDEEDDATKDDSGEVVIFDLSKEVGFQLDTMDSEQKTSFSTEKLADENSKQKGTSSSVKKPAVSGEASRCTNLWVSGLVVTVSAADLKALFSPFGQVISAKVVVRARSKGNRYGYVTMATPEQAEKSIKALHNTELKGWKIAVELAKSSNPKTVSVPSQEGGLDIPHSVDDEASGADVLPESKDEKSETGTPAEDGSDKDPQAKVSGTVDSTSDAPGVNAPTDETKRDSASKEDNSKDQSTSSGSTSGRRIIMVDKGGGKRELVRIGSAYGKARNPPHRPLLRAPSPPPRMGRGFGRLGRGMITCMPRLSPPRNRGDVRHELLRGGMEHRSIHSRLGRYVDPRAMEMQFHEERQRILFERDMEREHLRRELEMEQHRKEQLFVRQMEEVRAREAQRRSFFEQKQREAVERERMFHQREQQIHEKERMIQERERRERERLEALEKQKEREYRERERRFREQLEKEMREKEAHLQKERELREQQLRLQEQELMEKQNRLRDEQERQAKLKEQERREQERQRRLQEEEIQRERERIREQERKERERNAGKRAFPGDQSDIPAKRQSFSPDTDSRPSYAPFARGRQPGIARDDPGRPVVSPYAHNQNKSKESTGPYSRNTPMQDQSGADGFGYGPKKPTSQFGGKFTSPGFDSPHEGPKGRSPFSSLTPELISAASHALDRFVGGGSLGRSKDLGRVGAMGGGYSRLPQVGQRNLGSSFASERSPSEMVSYPSAYGQTRSLSQPNLPRSGLLSARPPAYRNSPGDNWYNQGGYSSFSRR